MRKQEMRGVQAYCTRRKIVAMPLLAVCNRVAGLVVSFASFELLFARLRFQIYFLHSMVAVVAVAAIPASATTGPYRLLCRHFGCYVRRVFSWPKCS